MKKIFLLLLLLMIVPYVFAEYPFENSKFYYYTDVEGQYYFEFHDGIFTIYRPNGFSDDPNPNKYPLPGSNEYYAELIQGAYSIKQENDVILLDVNKHRFCILYNNDIITVIYDVTEPLPSPIKCYFGVNKKYCILQPYVHSPLFTPEATNQVQLSKTRIGLTKSGISYNPPFSRMFLSGEWIIENSSGINEWIDLDIQNETRWVVFINGFIYPQNYSYFLKNNRIKSIRIAEPNNPNKEEILELMDNPNPQIIKLPEGIFGSKIRITINDIYKGKEFNDTCVGFIGYFVNIPEEMTSRLNAIIKGK